jgi:hypothetical protein
VLACGVGVGRVVLLLGKLVEREIRKKKVKDPCRPQMHDYVCPGGTKMLVGGGRDFFRLGAAGPCVSWGWTIAGNFLTWAGGGGAAR